MALLDIHTHRTAPYPTGIISADINTFVPVEGQLYSLGVHPWDAGDFNNLFARVEAESQSPHIVAIGECGIDTLRGGPMFEQLNHFKAHIELSEKLKKPLIIHDVKAHDIIIGCRRDLKPSMTWIIHGFRGKPSVAQMLLKAGCMLSYGEKFNPESLVVTPDEFLLAETDESSMSITSIIETMSAAAGRDLHDIVMRNTGRIICGQNL